MPGPKQNNRRVYPDATRQPRQFDAMRKREAKERQEAYAKLSLEEKLARLPAAPAAAKQRAKLMALLEKKNQKAENEKVVAEQAEANEQVKQTKKSRKGQG